MHVNVFVTVVCMITQSEFNFVKRTVLLIAYSLRSALQATAFIVSQLRSLGLECSVDEVGPALGFSEIVQRSNRTFARNFRQCGGKPCCSWGGLFQLIKYQTKKPGRFDSLVPLQAFSPGVSFKCRLSDGVCRVSVCNCMHQ